MSGRHLVVQEVNRLGFYKFLETNKRVWEEFPKTDVEPGTHVLGLNLANHPGAVMGNCIFLRFMAHFLKAEPAIITCTMADKPMLRLLESYGITKVDAIDEVSAEMGRTNLRLLKEYEERGAQSPRAMLNFSVDGIHFGDLIYDGHLRNNALCSIDSTQDTLPAFSQFAWAYAKAMEVVHPGKTKALLSEFNTFHMQAAMCRYAVSKDVPVYLHKPASNIFTVRRYTNAEDVRKSEYEFEREEFLELYREHGEFMAQEGRKMLHKRFFVPEEGEHDCKEAFVRTEPDWTRERLLTGLGMDPGKPVVCIMNHCFIDQPHGQGEMYFNDYVDWLTRTLRIASTNTGVNWLVREHPHQKSTYESPLLAEDIVRDVAGGCAHVQMMPDEIKTPNLLNLVDYMVTCFGSCSLEFPAFGTPCVALPGWTTGYDFNAVPKNQLEYKRVLENITDLQPPTREESDLASAYFYNYYALARVKTNLLPSMTGSYLTEDDEIVAFAMPFAAELLEKHPLTEDPFYYLVKRMVEEDRASIVNYDLLPQKGSASATQRAEPEATTRQAG